jgi:hypothetical protein
MAVNGFDATIQWSKFKQLSAKPVDKDGDAETVSAYASSQISLARRGKGIVASSANVTIAINSHESWVVTGKTDPYLLKHEQGHYDITALAARQFYSQIMKLEVADVQAFNTAMKSINDDIKKKIESTNIRYDKQTGHSRNTTGQTTWNQKIDATKKNPNGTIDDLP